MLGTWEVSIVRDAAAGGQRFEDFEPAFFSEFFGVMVSHNEVNLIDDC